MCNLHSMNDTLDPLFASVADLVVARNLPFPEFSEQMKAHLVSAAMARADGKVTDSRLSVMTGLQRRDVARLRAFEAKTPRPTPMTRLVSLWRTDPRYAPEGDPIPIDRTGDCPSFDHLARLVRQDVHPRTLFDALLEAGTIEVAQDKVLLLERAYDPRSGIEDQLAYLAANVGDHLRGATANVGGAEPPFFERALHYTDLTESQVVALQAAFADAVMEILETLRRSAEQMKQENMERRVKDADFRVRFGSYAYTQIGEKS